MKYFKYIFLFSFFINSSLFALNCQDYINGNASHTSDLYNSSNSVFDETYYNDNLTVNDGTGYHIGAYFCYDTSKAVVDKIVSFDKYGNANTYSYYLASLPTCSGNDIWDLTSNSCVSPPCTSLSEYTVNIPESDCLGSITDTNNQVRGILSFQQCDSTCYITEAVPLTCDELAPLFRSSCDTTKNNFSFQCTDINGTANVDVDKTFCKKKSNPCDDLFDKVEATCTNTQVITGYPECRHDGINVLNPEVIKCVDDNSSENPKNQKPWDCSTYFHKVWNDSNKSCSCESGYELSFYGSCKKSLDSNATDEQKNSADNDAKNDAQKEEQMKNDRNNSLEQNRHLSNIENTLSGISRELNSSTSLLGSIKDLIGGLSSKFDSNGSSGVSFNPETSFTDLEDNYATVNSTIDDLKNMLSNGLVNPIPSGSGNSCAYSNVISGNGLSIPVTFDPCEVVAPYYSTLYNIWYFLIFVMFLVFSIKLLLISKGD